MERQCAICGKKTGLFTLELQDDDGEKFHKHVCGSCWEIIAAIAKLAVKAMLKKEQGGQSDIPSV